MKAMNDRPVAIVTGASRGLGEAVAMQLAQEGYDLSLAARSEPALQRLQAKLTAAGADSLVTAVDLTDPQQREDLVADTIAQLGRIDVLVNNAAVSTITPYLETGWEEVRYMNALNLEAPMHLSQLAAKHMVSQGSGSIVSISTIVTSMRVPGLTPYLTGKAGLEYFTRSLRKELEGTGVTVSAVLPGGIADTGMTRSLEARSGEKLKGAAARGLMSPEQVAKDVVRVVNSGRAEKVSAKGGILLRVFPRLGEVMMTKMFTPVMEAASEHDQKHGRKVSDPTTEEITA